MQAEAENRKLGQDLALRYVIFGGEALELGDLPTGISVTGRALTLLINMYGPTETTVHVSYLALDQHECRRGGPTPDRARPIRIYVCMYWMGTCNLYRWECRGSSTLPGRGWHGVT